MVQCVMQGPASGVSSAAGMAAVALMMVTAGRTLRRQLHV